MRVWPSAKQRHAGAQPPNKQANRSPNRAAQARGPWNEIRTMITQPTLTQRTLASELRALLMVARKEWTLFRRYPSWVVSMFIWPVLFPVGYIFSAKALGGPDGAALASFKRLTGTADYVG